MTGTARVFLSEVIRENRAPDQILLFACYDIGAFDPALYAQNDIPLPDRFEKSVPKRQAEFLAGRMLAQRAVNVLGAAGPVIRGSLGEPLWPKGVRGSISHSGGRVGVWATSANWHPGLDIEHLVTPREADAIRAGVLTEAERQFALSRAELTAVFSAKEALFKGLFPHVGRRFGFSSAELVALPKANGLTLKLTCALAERLPSGQKFDIQIVQKPDRVESYFQGPAT